MNNNFIAMCYLVFVISSVVYVFYLLVLFVILYFRFLLLCFIFLFFITHATAIVHRSTTHAYEKIQA